MIPQNKIDEAANLFAEQRRLDSRGYPPKVWFKAGVQFALNEIEPLICEFIEEVVGDGWILRADGWQNVMDYKISEFERRTTQQLLEEFIKSKNK